MIYKLIHLHFLPCFLSTPSSSYSLLSPEQCHFHSPYTCVPPSIHTCISPCPRRTPRVCGPRSPPHHCSAGPLTRSLTRPGTVRSSPHLPSATLHTEERLKTNITFLEMEPLHKIRKKL